jgi:hypothetical protein
LNGATFRPRRAKRRHSPAVNKLLPTEELVPWTIRKRAAVTAHPSTRRKTEAEGRECSTLRKPIDFPVI